MNRWIGKFVLHGAAGVGPWLCAVLASAAGPDYARDVQPIFAKHCYSCHGPDDQTSSYRLDVRDIALKGGDSGAVAIVPHQSAASALIRHVSSPDPELRMPPGDSDVPPLSAEQIATLEAWIDAGPVWPDELAGSTDDGRMDHWAWKPVTRPDEPAGDEPNPIDRLLLAHAGAAAKRLAPEADPRSLVRRLTYDLTGLPPTNEDVIDFENDHSPAAYDALVARLLDSPRYGERWGRKWLDVVRYADTAGDTADFPVMDARRYRNWVIDACNRDVPYDEFLRQQLAGDILAGLPDSGSADMIIATGYWALARPSMGAWVSYGLGTENANLPSYVVLAPKSPYAGSQVWASDFLPACHQGTRVIPGGEPIPNLARRGRNEQVQMLELAALREWNREHLAARAGDPLLAARLKSFETAFGMQMEAPEAFDLSRETDDTLAMYGLERGQTTGFGWQCLAARRLVERGVRFVELIDSGADAASNWDSHGTMADHGLRAKDTDRPVAGLLKDLKDRGLLSDTLVVWATEFGRTPFSKDADNGGREHHAWAFSCWMAGAGVKPGIVHGETDDHGWKVVKDPVHVHDFHATILHLLGFDHKRLTYRHAGRDFRLTDVEGNVVQAILT